MRCKKVNLLQVNFLSNICSYPVDHNEVIGCNLELSTTYMTYRWYIYIRTCRCTYVYMYIYTSNWGEPERAPPRALQRLRSLSHNNDDNDDNDNNISYVLAPVYKRLYFIRDVTYIRGPTRYAQT